MKLILITRLLISLINVCDARGHFVVISILLSTILFVYLFQLLSIYFVFLLGSIICSDLTFLATPTDLGTFPYFTESTLDVLGCMAFSVPIAKDE